MKAVAVRKAYPHWLVGAACETPAGLERALEVLGSGRLNAVLTVMDVLTKQLGDGADRRRVGEAMDLRNWDGADRRLEPA